MKRFKSKINLKEGKYLSINIGDIFNPPDGGQVKVIDIIAVNSGRQYVAQIEFEYVSPEGRRGKSSEEATSFANNYMR